jgi:hypothetical protein
MSLFDKPKKWKPQIITPNKEFTLGVKGTQIANWRPRDTFEVALAKALLKDLAPEEAAKVFAQLEAEGINIFGFGARHVAGLPKEVKWMAEETRASSSAKVNGDLRTSYRITRDSYGWPFMEGDAAIEAQLHPKLVKYYRKYCSYAAIADNAAWGYYLLGGQRITIKLGKKSYKAIRLIEWLKRKAANCTTFQIGRIAPPPGQEGDVVCEILALSTVASLASDRELSHRLLEKSKAVLEAYLDVLQKIDAVGDMRTCIKEIQDERSEV